MSLKLFLRRGESSPRIPPEHPFLRFYRRSMVENMLKFSVLQEENAALCQTQGIPSRALQLYQDDQC